MPTCHKRLIQNSFYYNSAICYLFLFYCTFSPSMFWCLYFPCACFRDPVLPPLFSFLSLSLHLCVLRVSSAPFLHFSCIGMKMKKSKSQVITKTESRTRDRNGTCVFGSINVLYRNRCWKIVKKKKKIKTYFCNIVGKLNWQTRSLEK